MEQVYEFGCFRLDRDQRLLWNGKRIVKLHPKAFELLLLFVENPGRLLEKKELMQKLWHDQKVFVEESNLTNNVAELRKKLRDNARQPKYIQNIFKVGYCFISEVIVKTKCRPSDEQLLPTSVRKAPRQSIHQSAKPKSLANFPEDFLPLTIICGDRRFRSPLARGDMFVESASTTDLMFLLKLGLPTDCLVTSDKNFARLTEEELKKEFGHTNVLVIGSPMVNLASRFFNQRCLFRFALDRDLIEIDRKLRALTLIDGTEKLKAFWEMATNPQKTSLDDYQGYEISQPDLAILFNVARQIFGRGKPSSYVVRFASELMIDPTVGISKLRKRFHEDFAILSLGRNPFAISNDYVCIMAAGIGGTGTAHAVRFLSEAEKSFAEHPFGGILQVDLDMIKLTEHQPMVFEKATAKWRTKDYQPETIIENLKTWLRHSKGVSNPAHSTDDELFTYLSVEDIEECLRFVRAISWKKHIR